MERVKIRGLAFIFAGFFFIWGLAVTGKSVYDLFWGEPEANAYAPHPWGFVTKEEWLRYGGFELAYGLACLGLAFEARRYGQILPEFIERKPLKDSFDLFK